MTAETAKWWENHRALRGEIMQLIVRDWACFKTPEETRQHLVKYLSVRTDWLPCDVETFIRKCVFADDLAHAAMKKKNRPGGAVLL